MYADQELVISFFGEERQTYSDIQWQALIYPEPASDGTRIWTHDHGTFSFYLRS